MCDKHYWCDSQFALFTGVAHIHSVWTNNLSQAPFVTLAMDMHVTIATVTKVNIKDADFQNSSLITDDSTLSPNEAQVYLSNWIINWQQHQTSINAIFRSHTNQKETGLKSFRKHTAHITMSLIEQPIWKKKKKNSTWYKSGQEGKKCFVTRFCYQVPFRYSSLVLRR